jgi:cilia- and flagella-associated protein 57
LDYKIKELKRDIGPRGKTIDNLKLQTNKMQQEQEHFKKVAANLGLIVEDLRMRMSGLRMEQEKLTS